MPKSYHERYLAEKEKQALAKVRKEQRQKEKREAKERQRVISKEVKRQVRKLKKPKRSARGRSLFGFKKKRQGKPLSRKRPIGLI